MEVCGVALGRYRLNVKPDFHYTEEKKFREARPVLLRRIEIQVENIESSLNKSTKVISLI